jgi:hypothetical protein
MKREKDLFGDPKFRSRRDVAKAAITEFLVAHGWNGQDNSGNQTPKVEVPAR